MTTQLAQIKSVTQLDADEHNEANIFAKSLIEIDAARVNLGMHMEDLVVWEDLDDELYKEKFDRVSKDLKEMIKAIRQSKSLKSVLDETEK